MEIFQLNGMLNLVQVFMKKLAGGQKSNLDLRLMRKGIYGGTKDLIIF